MREKIHETEARINALLKRSKEREAIYTDCLIRIFKEISSSLPAAPALAELKKNLELAISGLGTQVPLEEEPEDIERYQEASVALLEKILTDLKHYYEYTLGMAYDNAIIRFQLSQTVQIIKVMTGHSNAYATERMQRVLDSFKGIASFSDTLGRELASTTRSLLDKSDNTSLAAISQESTIVSREMDSLLTEIDKLRGFIDELRQTTGKQFERIRQMAQGIEDFSETIRIITLNLNVEAARLSGASSATAARNSGRSFQVLAKNMSEFAQKAQDLSREEGSIIDGALVSLTKVNQDFLGSLEALLRRIPEIRGRIEPFDKIVARSEVQLQKNIKGLESLSGDIDRRLKEIIGQLQFQDLSRQESEHFADFLELALLKTGTAMKGTVSHLDEEASRKILEKLFHAYARIATTVNEREVLRKAGQENGLGEFEFGAVEEELPDGEVRLF